MIKLDHQFNEKNNIAIRYFGGTGNQTEYVGSAMPYYFQEAAQPHAQLLAGLQRGDYASLRRANHSSA